MRLIDADKLLYDDIKDIHGDTLMVVHAPEIDEAPTAFDKEKVISILTDELRLSEMEKERCATENPSQLRYANGYANGVDFALEIIKKGGIE